jgi:hypothetical protein
MSSTAASQPGVKYLVPAGTAADTSGAGVPFELGELAGQPLVVVLEITEIIEQESLEVSLWGSADGNDWGTQALFAYPQQFYRGVTPAALDLSQRPELRFLQARWAANRWGRGYPRPYFVFSLEIQRVASQ